MILYPIELLDLCLYIKFLFIYGMLFSFASFADARKQVKEATERLGGDYSPHLHSLCTHLVVQISFFIFYSCLLQLVVFGFDYRTKHDCVLLSLS